MAEAVEDEGGGLVGLCNQVLQPTRSLAPTCRLQDLDLDPAAPGTGAARALILPCEALARDKGCVRVDWLTQEFNAPARSLCDTVAQRTFFVIDRKPL